MSMDPTRMRDASFGSDRLDSLLTRIEMEERGEDGGPMLSPLLLAHPDDEPYSEDDHTSGNSRLVGGGDYVRQNMRMVRRRISKLFISRFFVYVCIIQLSVSFALDDCHHHITHTYDYLTHWGSSFFLGRKAL